MSLSGWIAGLSALVLMGGSAEAGRLEPPGPPAPTMKTLDEVPPTWSQVLPANDTGDPCNSSRFKCVLPGAANPTGEAVLDRETGLVWQRTPSSGQPSSGGPLPWGFAFGGCVAVARAGNRSGFRLPTVEELMSLIDPAAPTGQGLPVGHPFSNVQPGFYWSGTSDPSDVSRAYAVPIDTFIFVTASLPKVDNHSIWCVRGGQGYDGQ